MGFNQEPYYDNGHCQLYQADAREIPLPDQSVHCVVTSPPYFGLRVYQDNDDQGIGRESTVETYIANLVDVFREVWRVLRDDGVCWVNLGDSMGANYRGGNSVTSTTKQLSNTGTEPFMGRSGASDGNRLGIPERVVLALQATGWIWRDTVIWAKKSAMPESVNGWRWEQCRVKVAPATNSDHDKNGGSPDRTAVGFNDRWDGVEGASAQWQDCPGCPKCAANGGLVLQKGSWRTTSAHEYIFMLVKKMGYFCDAEAVKTAYSGLGKPRAFAHAGNHDRNDTGRIYEANDQGGANRRSVWNDISPEPYGGPHYATFPSGLPRICIQASTSEAGVCSQCGSQWARVVEKGQSEWRGTDSQYGRFAHESEQGNLGHRRRDVEPESKTIGWRPTCSCDAPAIPATVLDPFAGTFTTGVAAQRLGRRAVGIDISEEYLKQSVNRLGAVPLPLL